MREDQLYIFGIDLGRGAVTTRGHPAASRNNTNPVGNDWSG